MLTKWREDVSRRCVRSDPLTDSGTVKEKFIADKSLFQVPSTSGNKSHSITSITIVPTQINIEPLLVIFTISENKNKTGISKASSYEEIADFWDTHSLIYYWDQTQEAEFEVRAKRRRRVTLDPEMYIRIASEAQTRGILPETLVNLWLANVCRQQNS